MSEKYDGHMGTSKMVKKMEVEMTTMAMIIMAMKIRTDMSRMRKSIERRS